MISPLRFGEAFKLRYQFEDQGHKKVLKLPEDLQTSGANVVYARVQLAKKLEAAGIKGQFVSYAAPGSNEIQDYFVYDGKQDTLTQLENTLKEADPDAKERAGQINALLQEFKQEQDPTRKMAIRTQAQALIQQHQEASIAGARKASELIEKRGILSSPSDTLTLRFEVSDETGGTYLKNATQLAKKITG